MTHPDDITDWIDGVYFEITDGYVDVITTYVEYSIMGITDDTPMAVARTIAKYAYLMDDDPPKDLTVIELESRLRDLVLDELSAFVREDELKSIVYDSVNKRHVCKCIRCLRPLSYGPTRHIARENAYGSDLFGTRLLKGNLCKMCVQEVFPRLSK